MRSLAKAIISRREFRRNQRELDRALDRIGSPAARDEIKLAAQRLNNAGR